MALSSMHAEANQAAGKLSMSVDIAGCFYHNNAPLMSDSLHSIEREA